MSPQIPTTMKAIRYNKIKDYELVTMPVPTPNPDEILVKGEDYIFSVNPEYVIKYPSKIVRDLRYRLAHP